MKLSVALFENQTRRDWFMVLAFGPAAATALVAAMGMSFKWTVFILVVLGGVSALVICQRRQELLLYLTVFCLPIGLDFHLQYIDTPHVRSPIYGFMVTAADLPFFILVGLWLVQFASDYHRKVRLFPAVTVPLTLIGIISLVTVVFVPTPGGAPGGIQLAGLWLLFKNGLLFLYMANHIRDRRTVFILVALVLAGGAMQSLLGYLQYFKGSSFGLAILGESEDALFVMKAGAGSVSRVSGTFGHANKLAVYLGMLIQVNFALLFAPVKRSVRLGLLACLGLTAIAMLLTFSRGGWLGLAAGGLLTAYWCVLKHTGRKVISAAICLWVALSIALVVILTMEPVRRRLLGSDYGTAAVRLPLAQVALNMVRRHPLTGVGINNYTFVMPHYDDTSLGITESFPAPVHNEFLLIAAEFGLPSLLLFLMILATVFKWLLRIGGKSASSTFTFLGIGFFGAWTGWCLHHQFEYQYAFFSGLIWFFFGLIAAIKHMQTECPGVTLCAGEKSHPRNAFNPA